MKNKKLAGILYQKGFEQQIGFWLGNGAAGAVSL
jgi:hypothetical protein